MPTINGLQLMPTQKMPTINGLNNQIVIAYKDLGVLIDSEMILSNHIIANQRPATWQN